MKGLISNSGGWHYHLKAARFSESLWTPTRTTLSQWLEDWITQYPHREILTIGPSGGYLLDTSTLQKASSIHAFDFDPLARVIFQHRHGLGKWTTQDLFSGVDRKPDLEHFGLLLKQHPDSILLFCNILGQIPTLYKEPTDSWPSFWADLEDLIGSRPYFSFHDRISTNNAIIQLEPRTLTRKIPLPSLLTHFLGEQIEVVDHQTESLFEGSNQFGYLSWSVTESQHHLIEVCSR